MNTGNISLRTVLTFILGSVVLFFGFHGLANKQWLDGVFLIPAGLIFVLLARSEAGKNIKTEQQLERIQESSVLQILRLFIGGLMVLTMTAALQNNNLPMAGVDAVLALLNFGWVVRWILQHGNPTDKPDQGSQKAVLPASDTDTVKLYPKEY